MAIVFNNAIRNGGQMPKIQATTDINTIVGQNNSLALDINTNTLYYWEPYNLIWIALTSGGLPGLPSVLSVDNVAYNSITLYDDNFTVNNGNIISQDNIANGVSKITPEGYELLNYNQTQSFVKINNNGFGSGLIQILNYLGGKSNLQPAQASYNTSTTLPTTTGQLYNLEFAAVTLTAGVGTYTVSGGVNNIVMGITVSNINTSSTIGVAYKWSAFGSLITITSLKTNGGTETSDVSTLNVAIAK